MAGPTPEQMLALNAVLQQGLQDVQQPQVSIPVSVQTASIGIDPNTIQRTLVLEGTLVSAGLDQVLMKTAMGEVILKVQQQQNDTLMNLIPSRVTLQMRPGPDGLVAVLVVGNKPLADKSVESLSSGTATSRPQTLAAEIPKISQIHQALVLPSSLFSSQTPEQFLASLTMHVQAKANAAVAAAQAQVGQTLLPQTSPTSSQPASAQQTFVGGLMQKLGFAPSPQATQVQGQPQFFPRAIPMPSNPNLSLPAQDNSKPMLEYTPVPSSMRPFPNVPPQISALLPEMPKPTAIKILGVLTPEEALKSRALAVSGLTDDGMEIAVVRGNTPSGQPVLSVGDKLIAVQGAKNWPVGMELKVAMGPQAGLVMDPGLESPELQSWSGLREALAAMAAVSPAAVADLARIRIPQPASQQLGGALLFFLAALQKGAGGWLGDEFIQRMKEMGREELLKRVEDQWRRQINQPSEGPGGEWRSITIPIFDQERMQALRLHIYNPPDQQKKKSKDDPNWARRFLIDLDLSRLGPVQFDGLVHAKRLDLVVRTDRALEPSLRTDLIHRFKQTMEEVRYTGTLMFSAHRAGWVDVREIQGEPVTKRL